MEKKIRTAYFLFLLIAFYFFVFKPQITAALTCDEKCAQTTGGKGGCGPQCNDVCGHSSQYCGQWVCAPKDCASVFGAGWSTDCPSGNCEEQKITCPKCTNTRKCKKPKSEPSGKCDTACGTCGYKKDGQCSTDNDCCRRTCSRNGKCVTVSGGGKNECDHDSDCGPTPTPTGPVTTLTPTVTPGGPSITPGGPSITPGGPTITPGGPTLGPEEPTPTESLEPTEVPEPTNTPEPTEIPATPTPDKEFVPIAVPTDMVQTTDIENDIEISLLPRSIGMKWKCLSAEKTSESHEGIVRLTGGGFPIARNIYMVGCIMTGGDYRCTTGDPTKDLELAIQKSSDHIYEMIDPSSNPVIVGSTGRVTAMVRSTSSAVTEHLFYGVYPADYDTGTGDEGSLKLGSFTTEDNYRNCVAIRWDPFGRVFDSQTLEPIANVKVTILNKNKAKLNLPGLINPVWTAKTGGFSFFVEPGDYYLEPGDLTDFSFVSNPSLNPNYKQFYTNIYKPGQLITEKPGLAEERDIPLVAKGKSYKTDINQINFNIVPISGADKTKLIGQVSHPLTIVSFYQDKKKIGEAITDKYGFYDHTIDSSMIRQDIPIIPRYVKFDFFKEQEINTPASNNLLVKLVDFINSIFGKRISRGYDATVSGSGINLVPRYIEGYAYDKQGNLLKNTNVYIVLMMSKQTVFFTKTDDNGYLKVLPKDLPIFPYFFAVAVPESSDVVYKRTEEFVNENKNYLEQNNINLINATKNNQPVTE